MTKKSGLRIVGSLAGKPGPKDDALVDDEERAALIAEHGLLAVERSERSLRENRKKVEERNQPLYQELFPGTPERAQRLGRIYQKLRDTILGNMYTLEEPERAEMRAALEDVIPFLTGRPPRRNVQLDKAPTLWAERDHGSKVSPAAFTRDNYKSWIGQGLT